MSRSEIEETLLKMFETIERLHNEVDFIQTGQQPDSGAAHVMLKNLHTFSCILTEKVLPRPSSKLQAHLNERIRITEVYRQGIVNEIESLEPDEEKE